MDEDIQKRTKLNAEMRSINRFKIPASLLIRTLILLIATLQPTNILCSGKFLLQSFQFLYKFPLRFGLIFGYI